MTDPRFTTVVYDTEELLNVVDIDEIGDVETLLMFLFARPVGVAEVWNPDREENSLDVVIQGNDEAVGFILDFPLSVVELARACGHAAEGIGPHEVVASHAHNAPQVTALDDDELVTALQSALGKVRLFNMMDDAGTSK